MQWMFRNARAFNSDISGWNTNKVTNFYATFSSAHQFNIPIGVWSTSQVPHPPSSRIPLAGANTSAEREGGRMEEENCG